MNFRTCLIGAVVSIFLVTLQCFADITLEVHNKEDGSKIVSWNSEPGATYTIESAEDFGSLTTFQLRWTVRETSYPSQGTTTSWMDVGDSSWIPRLPHPRLSLMRYYRISKTGISTLASPAVSFSLYKDSVLVPSGQTITGDLEIRYNVDLGTSGDLLNSVLILVDGQVVSRCGTLTGSYWINTTEWPNSQHIILVVAQTIDSADATQDNSTTDTQNGVGVASVQTVTFDNFISGYFVASPFFSPSVDGLQEIVASFKEASYWRLSVLQSGQYTISVYEGTGSSLYVAWDGTDGTSEVSDGYYDYYIEACPTRLGPFSLTSPLAANRSVGNMAQQARVARDPQSSTMLFTRDHTFRIPASDKNPMSLAPVTNSVSTNDNGFPVMTMQSANLGLDSGSDDPRTICPPLPPEFSPLETEHVISLALMAAVEMDELTASENTQSASKAAPQTQTSNVDTTQTTSTPIRIPGSMFKGFAGTFGVGYQGHHPKWQDVGFFSMPTGVHGATASYPPWGPIKNASSIANMFSKNMTSSGWRRSFQFGDNQFCWYHLSGCWRQDQVDQYNPPAIFGGAFGRGCELGLVVGHMISANTTPFYAQCSYYPFWNPDTVGAGCTWRSYSWIGMPDMDFGQSSMVLHTASPLKWIGLYGCNSLRLQDVNDQWSKFLLPFPSNLRVLLGSDSGVFMVPEFGKQFADDLNGASTISGGYPMSLINSWNDAATVAHAIAATTRNPLKRPGTIIMSAVYRGSGEDGPGTSADTIWSYRTDSTQSYMDIQWNNTTVHQ